MESRVLSLYVENHVGVLAKISGLFSGKSYNLESLTVGATEDETISRMTIRVKSDDVTFEQIKKQLNRCVEVIKVIDLTGKPMYMKELMFIKILACTEEDKAELFRIAQVFSVSIVDYDLNGVMIQSVQSETKNNEIIHLIETRFKSIEIVRGGGVAIERLRSII